MEEFESLARVFLHLVTLHHTRMICKSPNRVCVLLWHSWTIMIRCVCCKNIENENIGYNYICPIYILILLATLEQLMLSFPVDYFPVYLQGLGRTHGSLSHKSCREYVYYI